MRKDQRCSFAGSFKIAMQAPSPTAAVMASIKNAKLPVAWLSKGSSAIGTVPASGWLAIGRSVFDPMIDNPWQRSIKRAMASIPTSFVGIASMYNPYSDGNEDDAETASGERYDPAAWTAAIQIDLRDWFGGVRYGRLYRPAFALVECEGKRTVVKINDVGPLKPGRVIDLYERTMRYFDPTLERGLIDAKITLLPGDGWTPGPVKREPLLTFVSAQ